MHGADLGRKKSEYSIGNFDITIESIIDDESRLHDYGFSRSTWLRGVRLMKRFGSEEALELMDQRADGALERGNLALCNRWRDLMGVIHAIEADEPLPSDRIQ
ncbi:hypothetical protein [Nitratireductor thuwali]|uniref:hypothetical protein n=1 Tax=Nitratireductor thuwali TaxID=2267699 RepID=UPI0030CC6AD0